MGRRDTYDDSTMSSLLLPADTAPGETSSRRGASPAWPLALAVAALLGTWLLSGVPPGDVLRWGAFEALYVVAPGCVLYLLLSRRPGGWLWVLAIGWPLGYALGGGAVALTAAG